jgi:cytochrome c biogenesis protein CcmG/thiol:disulfide interchange protein DsbE
LSVDGPESSDAVDVEAPRRRRWRTLALVLLPLAAFALLLAASLGRDPRALPSELVGDRAPTFALANLDGSGTVDMADLGGQVVVVNFWASWCLECRDEHPALDAAWNRYRERGVVFVGVLFEDDAESGLAFADEFGTDWPLVQDAGSRTAIEYGVFGVPETFVVAADGTVVAKRVGPVDYTWLTDRIEEALRTPESA